MSEPGRGCVVVGAGLAAAHVVQTLRDGGYSDPVHLIGEESERPYERPALSKSYLQGKKEAAGLYVHDEAWYGEHQIDTHFGERVSSIDRSARQVTLASGGTLGYAHLVLATGAWPRQLNVPGTDLAGVHYLRTRSDSDALRAALANGHEAVIIGGGWIGLEVAAAARIAGLGVTLLEAAPLPLLGVLGEEMGRYFADLHRAHGVDVRTDVSVSSVAGSAGTVTGVEIDGGPVSADVVVVAVGVSPATELAEQAGLRIGNGVVADERLRTSDPAILAAGDVVTAQNTATGGSLRVEHWDNAIRQGKLAGQVILGRNDVYDWQPYFFTDQYDLGMEYVGHGSPDDEVVIRGDKSSGAFIAFWVRDGYLTAGMNVNIWDVNDQLRALVGQPVATARLRDESIPLTELGDGQPE